LNLFVDGSLSKDAKGVFIDVGCPQVQVHRTRTLPIQVKNIIDPRSFRKFLLKCEVHIPADHGALAVEKAMREAIATLPAELMRSITWDQGTQMASHPILTTITNALVRQ